MQSKTKLRFGVVATVAAAALAFGAAVPAYADPATNDKILNGVGSDTTQDLVGGLASVVTSLGSWDATGSSTIKTTPTGNTFNRPNGSGSGVQALSASVNNTGTRTFPASGGVSITGQVDFARSSSPAAPGTYPGTDLTFIPFARDAVTYAVNVASDFPRDIALGSASQDSISPAPFTLRNIYRGAVTQYIDADLNPVTITPLVPQANSGTRTFWLSQLGLIESQIAGVATDKGGLVQEHNGGAITGPGDIVPFSIAQYIAQGNHGALPTAVTERRGNIALGSIGTIKPIVAAPGGGVQLNSAFPVNRLVYNVVQTSRLTGTSAADVALQNAFAGPTSQVCAAASTIRQYGFGTISNCGDTTTAGNKQGFRY